MSKKIEDKIEEIAERFRDESSHDSGLIEREKQDMIVALKALVALVEEETREDERATKTEGAKPAKEIQLGTFKWKEPKSL